MRKVILSLGVSLDGYIARPNGAVDFLVMSKEGSKAMASLFAGIDTIIFGRKTYDESLKLGPAPQGPWTTYVFSRSLPSGERNGLVFVKESPTAFVRRLRKRRGKDICHMGGGELARSFLKADLVDELFLGIIPVLIGDGIPAFPRGFPQRDFKLVESHADSKGGVSLKYKRALRR